MTTKWVGQKKTINFSQPEIDGLRKYCDATGRTETDVLREALRRFLKEEAKDVGGQIN